MKKSLLALAAMGAFAGAAQAQSSVTVYGILDVGYTGGNLRSSNNTFGVDKTTTSRFSNNMESGSRVGLRGNEDLGGGTSAQFVFEVAINPAGSQGSFAGFGDMRQAFIGLTQKGMGNARIGTQNTLYWEQAGSNTTGQLAQTLGSMLAPTSAGAFSAFSTATGTASDTANQGFATDAYTARTTNTITLRTERMAGFMVKGAYTLNNQNQNQVGLTTNSQGYTQGTNNQNGWQVALDWNIAKANIQASTAVFNSINPYSYTAAQAALGGVGGATGAPVAWSSSAQGTNVKDAQTLVTASYDFGILRAYVGWANRQVTSAVNDNAYAKRTAQEIGVRGYATKTIEGWASVGNGRITTFGVNQPTANILGYQVGANYWMSKRTNLYAIYGQNGTSSSSVGAYNANQYSIGARHTF